ncbi:MAG: helix-turn-helix transcriptional regulator, partial [Paenibacillaceae bacterium]|nr:helix-turn-helix transcriptional regulator [Paenibacillaceae bacterium]
LSAVMMKLLLNDLKGTVAKLGDQIAIDDPKLAGQIQTLLAPADRPEDAQETMRAIERMCLHISDIVDRRKKSHNDQLLTNVMQMIHEQYRSSSFSLGVVAETFRISEVYVSYFIKEQTGVTFSEYVERLRMEQAKAMLMDDRYSVKDIAEQVGYNSSNTFCRAFKRMNGVSTTDYKKATAGV